MKLAVQNILGLPFLHQFFTPIFYTNFLQQFFTPFFYNNFFTTIFLQQLFTPIVYTNFFYINFFTQIFFQKNLFLNFKIWCKKTKFLM